MVFKGDGKTNGLSETFRKPIYKKPFFRLDDLLLELMLPTFFYI